MSSGHPATYCTICGTRLEDGNCPNHPRAARRAARFLGRPSVAVLYLALVALGALGVGIAGLVNSSNADLQATQASASLSQLRRALHVQTQALNGVSKVLGGVAAKVNATPNPAQIAATVGQSVFTVQTAEDEGTAWVVSSSPAGSELITNFHVVANDWTAGTRSVTLAQGNATYPGTIVQVSQGADLAEISVSQRFNAIPRAKSLPAPGDAVVIIGSPLGLGGSVSNGIVSAVRYLDGVQYIQFTAPISPGNSGSPVVNAAGEVIGIAEAKAVVTGSEGIGLAIPVAVVCSSGLSC